MKTLAYAVADARAPFARTTLERRDPGPHAVVIDISHCGICHSDLHQARDEWGGSRFPMVPGHEIVGRVRAVGSAVTGLRVGERAGVGCMVDSCRACPPCGEGLEQLCDRGAAMTYNGTEMDRATVTQGGYSGAIVVDEAFVLRVPESLDPAGAAPLLCAGITTYSPLREWGCKKGSRVAVVGLGGLGHMAVKLAASMGAEVTVISTSRSKEADARRMGAQALELGSDADTMKRLKRSFDLVLDTVSAPHDYDALLRTLRPRGTMILVGAPPTPTPIGAFSLISGEKRLVGSFIGGIAATQEMLDHCGRHGIVSDVEVITPDRIDEAYERLARGDVRYRFVIDTGSLRS